jgi:hypothetical protein
MNFNQLADETFAEACERYHCLMTYLPPTGMENWDFTQGFYYGLSQEAKEHVDNLARGTFFMLQNRLSRLALPTVPCILGPFKVHHVLCDWGDSMNILPKMVYDYFDEDPLVPTPHQLRLADSAIMQPYGIAKDVLIEFQDSSTLVGFMVMDMDPRQHTSIILGKPFLKSVKATIDKKRWIINMKVDGVHEKFIYHPKNLACGCQI